MKKVKTSKFVKILNKKRYKSANDYYYLIVDERHDEYLFTDNDLEEAKRRANKNKEDIESIKILNWTFKDLFKILSGIGVGIMLGIIIQSWIIDFVTL